MYRTFGLICISFNLLTRLGALFIVDECKQIEMKSDAPSLMFLIPVVICVVLSIVLIIIAVKVGFIARLIAPFRERVKNYSLQEREIEPQYVRV